MVSSLETCPEGPIHFISCTHTCLTVSSAIEAYVVATTCSLSNILVSHQAIFELPSSRWGLFPEVQGGDSATNKLTTISVVASSRKRMSGTNDVALISVRSYWISFWIAVTSVGRVNLRLCFTCLLRTSSQPWNGSSLSSRVIMKWVCICFSAYEMALLTQIHISCSN